MVLVVKIAAPFMLTFCSTISLCIMSHHILKGVKWSRLYPAEGASNTGIAEVR